MVGFSLTLLLVKSWLVQDQNVLGKDYSNPVIADSYAKTYGLLDSLLLGVTPCLTGHSSNEAHWLEYPNTNGNKMLLSVNRCCELLKKDKVDANEDRSVHD
ncbi:hypothetical protein Tco_1283633 [Tanacetum coccineum]